MRMTVDFYTSDDESAMSAQRRAQEIAFGPVIFQTARALRDFGVLALLASAEGREGRTLAEICAALGRPRYPIQVLLESGLSSGLVYLEGDRFRITKTGLFVQNDRMTRVNLDFVHDVCYQGLFALDEALATGRPAGLRVFGDHATVYEALSTLPERARASWFAYDHFYSDRTFSEALAIVFAQRPRRLLDVGGNTGRWALRCVAHDPEVRVTVVDLAQQIALMENEIAGQVGAERIAGHAANLLDEAEPLPSGHDAIWMSQFLDCFGDEQIVSLLRRAAAAMGPETTLFINEIYWDRQRFETAACVLNLSSPYFTAIANGSSKFIHYPDMERYLAAAGLRVMVNHDGLGLGHTLTECRLVGPASSR